VVLNIGQKPILKKIRLILNFSKKYVMKKILLFAVMIASGIAASAQFPTTVTTATNCFVFRNFNTSGEGFSSPSIYSGTDDAEFNWNAAAGAEIESSGLTVRSGSLISPIYVQAGPGVSTIGFKYIVPPGTEYRLRIISAVIGAPLEILDITSNGPVYSLFPATSGNICVMLSDADLIPGRLLRYEFTFRSNQPGDILFDDLAIEVGAGALPVTFEGFVARKNANGSLKLLWNVGEEVNVEGYFVESSTDGVNFTNAGYVRATGKSIYSLDYPGPVVKTIFFRVRNIDFDRSSKYTPVIRVFGKDQGNTHIQIYPVPATDMITIQHKESTSKSIITLVSPDGRILQRVLVSPNTYQTQLNVNKLAKGAYLVSYNDGETKVQSAWMVKN